MGAFKSTKTLNVPGSQIPGIASEIETVLKSDGYQVQSTFAAGTCHISVTKGGVFKAILGMKSALNVNISPQDGAVFIEASVGIFGQQAIPTVITMFFLWPVLIPQIWGMIQQSKLDDRVVAIAENYIARNAANASTANTVGQFCTFCGKPQTAGSEAKFCAHCGKELARS